MYNTTLGELWLDSPDKNKIVLGIHDLECAGSIREARYRDSLGRRYDGIHMYGPSGMKAYTVSVLDILLESDIPLTGQFSSGSEYFRNLSNFKYPRRRHRVYTDRDIRPNRRDSDNDRDVRPKNFRHRDDRYAVPTSNRFGYLNW